MKRFLCVISGLMFFALSGCFAGKAPLFPGVGKTDVVSEYRELAMSLEKQGEAQEAIFWWQVIQTLNPEDKEVKAKIASLQALAQQKAKDHYKKAQDLAERGELNSARLQAIIALRYDPNHLDALAMINKERGMIQHRVQSGETLATIAEKYYHDPDKALVIAYFCDLPGKTVQPAPGMLLEFPLLPIRSVAEPKETTPEMDAIQEMETSPEMDALLAEARIEFKNNKYQNTVVLAEKIVNKEHYKQEAQLLLNMSYLAIGRQHLRKGEYNEAENVLLQITEEFQGVKEVLAELDRQKRQQAEVHYRQGVKYYLNEDLTAAIREWQLTLKLFPGHSRAQENIKKAQAILEKLKTVQ